MKTKTILKLIILILIGFIFYSLFINDNITLNENNNNLNPGITEPDTSNNLFIEVSTEEEMATLLESGEVGSVYKYTGTTGTYENGTLYELTEEFDSLRGTWRFTLRNEYNHTTIPIGTYNLSYGVKYIGGYSEPYTVYTSTATYNQLNISMLGYDYGIIGNDVSLVNSNNEVINLNDYNNLIIGFMSDSRHNYTYVNGVITAMYAINYVDLDIYSSLNEVENGDALLALLQATATKQVSKQFTKLILKTDLEEITITENGEYSGEYSNITVEVPQPQLYAPTISLNGDILTITPNADNGAFVLSYDLYVDDVLVGNFTETTIDLSTLELEDGTYTITIVATGINFVDSVASNGVSYVVESDPLQGTWVFNDTLTFDTTNTASTRAMADYDMLVVFDFISNGSSYTGFIKLSTSGLKYREGSSVGGANVYIDDAINGGYTWVNENYKTIEITSTYDEITVYNSTLFSTPAGFLSWLQANATKK